MLRPTSAAIEFGVMETPAEAPSHDESSSTIVCRVTRWYFRRMGMLAGLLLAFGLAFLYDGTTGYPKSVELAKKKEQFINEFLPSFDVAKKEGTMEKWLADARAAGMPTGVDGEPPKWVSYAAANNWEEDPKMYSDREIAEQFWFAGGLIAGAMFVGMLLIWNRGKVLLGNDDHWVTPEGEMIPYASVFRVDKRKWDNKGLAYAWHRSTGSKEKRAVIDDLKFAGADKVLERILNRFSGELIEKVIEPDSPSNPSDKSLS